MFTPAQRLALPSARGLHRACDAGASRCLTPSPRIPAPAQSHPRLAAHQEPREPAGAGPKTPGEERSETGSRRDATDVEATDPRVEARVADVMSSLGVAFYSLDRQWRFSSVNAQAERVLDRSRDELVGGILWELFPAAVDSPIEAHFRAAMEQLIPAAFEAYYPAPLEAWYEVRARPTPDGVLVYFLDITAHKTLQDQTERAFFRAALLSEVTDELTSAGDPEEAVARLAQLLVPALGDWCIVTLVEPGASGASGDWRSQLRDVSWAHTDPATSDLLGRYTEVRLPAHTDTSHLRRAISSPRPYITPSPAAAVEELPEGAAKDLARQFIPASSVVLPLRARGRLLGLVTLCWATATTVPAEALAIATEIAARAGLALDNARLSARQRSLSEGLQRSLLTAPPEPDHVQIVVRYAPAAEAAQVGGDWYDAFLQHHGDTCVVIGDVAGHDVDAAAVMGQVRGLLRGIAVSSGDGPAEVLTKLDAVMQTLLIDGLASAVIARIEQTPDERDRGVSRVRWSNAGHPPPMVIHPDGMVQVLTGADADLMLGINPATQRMETVTALDRGATLFFYTDGLVERRGQSLEVGLTRLETALADLTHTSLDGLCDLVMERLLPHRPEDDVAIVAVRLHPQDRPRPADAGPNRIPPSVHTE
jgi:serine phosphatase RsbU (regulator of sigma subunit)/PAS domain-containing protein